MPLSVGRRGFLGGALAAGLVPRTARAAGVDRRFLFVNVYGGWDVTRVFAPAFDNALVAMEADATTAQAGGIPYVDHASRPSVRTFFEQWHDRACVVNGLAVPSVGHVECVRLAMTGDATGTSADWATLLGAARAGQYPLPHVIVTGPAFPGTEGAHTTRVGTTGQLAALLDGSLFDASELPVERPANPSLLDERVAERTALRAAAARGARHAAHLGAWPTALAGAAALEELGPQVRWAQDASFAAQAALAVDLLALGACRCVSLGHLDLQTWDSHAYNDAVQGPNFEDLFAGLVALLDTLAQTPGLTAPTLADEVVVVVSSEMGRTPHLNGGEGKDHWGTTSLLLVGPGVRGDQCIGGYNELFYGENIDFASGAVSPGGRPLRTVDLGATLLTLGDVDAGALLPDGLVVEALLGS